MAMELRVEPVIVAEARDHQVAEAAVIASMTGHHVFHSLCAGDVHATFERVLRSSSILRDEKVPPDHSHQSSRKEVIHHD